MLTPTPETSRAASLDPVLRAAMRALTLTLVLCSCLDPARAQCQAQELARITASDPFSMDEFGNAVAIDGDLAAIGVRQDDDAGSQSGSVYVERFDGSGWVEEAKLRSRDTHVGDEFGISVDVEGDTLVVGAHLDDDRGTDAGLAFVFEYDGSIWRQTARLAASDGRPYDNLGDSVAISGDVIVVGASLAQARGVNSGAAYVFRKPASGWQDMFETAKLVGADEAAEDEFGVAVDVSGDLAIVGAHSDADATGDWIGSAYIFRAGESGWTQQAKLTASTGAPLDRLGFSVAIGRDTALVGAWGDDDAAPQAGSAYVYRQPVTGWTDMTETARLTASDAAPGDHLGWSVALEGDVAVVAAPAHSWDGSGYGRVYVYVEPPTGWVDAVETVRLTASDAAYQDDYGYSVSVGGGRVLVGSRRSEAKGADAAGAAYVHGGLADCQPNGVIDVCDLAGGTSLDVDGDGVPDECEAPIGGAGSTSSLTLDKTAGAEITLSWAPSCVAGDSDFEVYEGVLGKFAGHAARACTTGGELSLTLLPSEADSYYLIAPANGAYEGSLGRDSSGADRPEAAVPCLPRLVQDCP